MMNRSRTTAFVVSGLAALLGSAACGGPSDTDSGAGDAASADTAAAVARQAPGEPRLSPQQTYACGAGFDATLDAPAIDPRLEGAGVHVTVHLRDDGELPPAWVQPLRVTVVRDDVELTVLTQQPDARPGASITAEWNGTAAQGGTTGAPATPVPAGTYAVRVTLGCSPGAPPLVRELPLAVTRVGVVQANVGAGDGERYPLLWHKFNHVRRNYWPAAVGRAVMVRGSGHGEAALDDASMTGAPARAFPAVWTDLETPPVTDAGEAASEQYNLPVALRAGTRPDLTLTFARGGDAAMGGGGGTADAGTGGGGSNGPRVRATITGATATGGDTLVTDGATGTFRLDATPAAHVGRYDVPVRVRYEVERADHTWALLGGEQFSLRMYGLIGPQTIDATRDTAPYMPWVAVVDAVAGWVNGRTADPDMVSSMIVHGVYNTLDLHYDTRNGASFYTVYGGPGYAGARFDLSAFLDRSNGRIVNCTDCASIVSTYANMIGCDLGYNIIRANFPLYYIKAIGTPAFTNDPFMRGSPGGFSYHAITSPIGDDHTFDATLDEDGDGTPASSPFTEVAPEDMPRATYLSQLTPSRVTVTYEDKTAIQ